MMHICELNLKFHSGEIMIILSGSSSSGSISTKVDVASSNMSKRQPGAWPSLLQRSLIVLDN